MNIYRTHTPILYTSATKEEKKLFVLEFLTFLEELSILSIFGGIVEYNEWTNIMYFIIIYFLNA